MFKSTEKLSESGKTDNISYKEESEPQLLTEGPRAPAGPAGPKEPLSPWRRENSGCFVSLALFHTSINLYKHEKSFSKISIILNAH